MPTQRFYIKGNGKAIHVGIRPGLASAASDYGVKVLPRNLMGRNRVDVIVSGKDGDIRAFWSYVKRHDVRLFPDSPKYDVTGLTEYDGPEPDWDSYNIALTAGQLGTGFLFVGKELKGITSQLQGIGGSLTDSMTRFDKIGDNLERIVKRLDMISGAFLGQGKRTSGRKKA